MENFLKEVFSFQISLDLYQFDRNLDSTVLTYLDFVQFPEEYLEKISISQVFPRDQSCYFLAWISKSQNANEILTFPMCLLFYLAFHSI